MEEAGKAGHGLTEAEGRSRRRGKTKETDGSRSTEAEGAEQSRAEEPKTDVFFLVIFYG
ncbi:hypothetical protein C1H46_005630 [Malus baccata]|uniref:Uncharacterized protein n=1 Tax=Malus baccata TaxID=106549 RepID=A0A540NCM7_MALBA|nr:hypothetical protein C1H46_005630 [Malus baccata]